MAQQVPIDAGAVFGTASDAGTIELLPDLAYRRVGIVNVVLSNGAQAPPVLIDAGLPGTAPVIRQACAARFGAGGKPHAIILTHGHVDHVGALETLLSEWDVPVYAHTLEVPYLDGSASYPPPDPQVGGGALSALSKLFPPAADRTSGAGFILSRPMAPCRSCPAGAGCTRPATPLGTFRFGGRRTRR